MKLERYLIYLVLIGFLGCQTQVNYKMIPAFSEKNILQCVIEIPSGTNKKIEYNKTSHTFEIDKKNGQERIINFLPYPGNYGFIPSTLSATDEGGDGDALDMLVIAEALPTGTILEVIPIGMLKLLDNGAYDYKIIGVPAKKELQIITATTYTDFLKKYPKAKEIIDSWFLNYDTSDILSSEGWTNEKEALKEIQKSLVAI